MLVFGHAGSPLLVFPLPWEGFSNTKTGDDRGAGAQVDRGELQLFCPDAVDRELVQQRCSSARAGDAASAVRALLLHELLPFVRWKNQSSQLAVTGCSFGGYHAVNFALKHPDVVTHCVSMSGAYDIHQFLDGYYDDDCYFNNPPDFLPENA